MMLSAKTPLPIGLPFSQTSAIKPYPDALGQRARNLPLPSFPLAMGAPLLAFGDSMIARTHVIAGSNGAIYSYLRTELGWLKTLDPRVNIDTFYDPTKTTYASGEQFNGGNQGYSGDHFKAVGGVPGMLNRIDYAISRGAKVVYFFGGTNCINSNDYATTADMVADYEVMLRKFRRAGIYVITRTVPPRGDWPAGDARYTRLVEWNAYIASLTGREGITVIDTRPVLGDGATVVSGVLAGDNVHQSDKGSRLVYNLLQPVISGLYAAGVFFQTDPLITGNALTNPGLTGTTGGKTGVTGSVATSWTATRQANQLDTIVGSKEVISTGFEKQVFSITASSTDTATGWHGLYLSPPGIGGTGPFAVGDWVRYGVFVELDSWPGWIALTHSQDIRGNNKSGYAMLMGQAAVPFIQGQGAISLWMVSEPIQLPAGMSDFRLGNVSGSLPFLAIYWDRMVTGTGVAKVSRPFLRKISDPRPAWNL